MKDVYRLEYKDGIGFYQKLPVYDNLTTELSELRDEIGLAHSPYISSNYPNGPEDFNIDTRGHWFGTSTKEQFFYWFGPWIKRLSEFHELHVIKLKVRKYKLGKSRKQVIYKPEDVVETQEVPWSEFM